MRRKRTTLVRVPTRRWAGRRKLVEHSSHHNQQRMADILSSKNSQHMVRLSMELNLEYLCPGRQFQVTVLPRPPMAVQAINLQMLPIRGLGWQQVVVLPELLREWVRWEWVDHRRWQGQGSLNQDNLKLAKPIYDRLF